MYISCTHTTQPDAWEFVQPYPSSSLRPVLLFLRMLYFSTSTATLCGTSLIEPLEWYTGLTVSLQVATLLVSGAGITYHLTAGSCVASILCGGRGITYVDSCVASNCGGGGELLTVAR